MNSRAVAFLALLLMFMGNAQAQTLLTEFTSGTSSTGWIFAWMRFQTSPTPDQGLHSVELELGNGGLATGEVRLELYASRSADPVCAPEFADLIETSDTVLVPIGRAFSTFNFTGGGLNPDTEYFLALRDDDYEGADQAIFFDFDPNFTGGGSGNNCGQLNHRVFVQDAVTPPAPALSIPFLRPPTMLLLALFVLILGFVRFQADARRDTE